MLIPAPSPTSLCEHLRAHLDAAALAWLEDALADAARPGEPQRPLPAWEVAFASAGRRCTPAPDGPAAADPAELADAARVLLLHTAGADAATAARLYHRGTAAERRAVLHALPHLDVGSDALPLVEDALRTNDTRLIAAAAGPYAAARLSPHAWRHAVLKCLFTGVPVTAVADLERRARGDGELARMLADYAAERTAAGRDLPADLRRVLDLATGPRTEEC